MRDEARDEAIDEASTISPSQSQQAGPGASNSSRFSNLDPTFNPEEELTSNPNLRLSNLLRSGHCP